MAATHWITQTTCHPDNITLLHHFSHPPVLRQYIGKSKPAHSADTLEIGHTTKMTALMLDYASVDAFAIAQSLFKFSSASTCRRAVKNAASKISPPPIHSTSRTTSSVSNQAAIAPTINSNSMITAER